MSVEVTNSITRFLFFFTDSLLFVTLRTYIFRQQTHSLIFFLRTLNNFPNPLLEILLHGIRLSRKSAKKKRLSKELKFKVIEYF